MISLSFWHSFLFLKFSRIFSPFFGSVLQISASRRIFPVLYINSSTINANKIIKYINENMV